MIMIMIILRVALHWLDRSPVASLSIGVAEGLATGGDQKETREIPRKCALLVSRDRPGIVACRL